MIYKEKIIFMGTPDFAVESLKALYENNFNIVGVITPPDKPAGRGQKLEKSAVKVYSEANSLKILQPINLKSPEFFEELKSLEADLQIVVAFRMLPEIVWSMPKFGTVNLHASLLPDYRGAAPINHAIIKGETKTGITTFFIEKDIDTGKIIKQKEIEILPEYNAGDLHDILMKQGGKLIVETVKNIFDNEINAISQTEILKNNVPKQAPKIFKENCKINWNQNVGNVNNFIRGLSPYPSAWTEIVDESGNVLIMKISKSEIILDKNINETGKIFTDNKKYIQISAQNGFINILQLQLQGKKSMDTKSFLNGFNISLYQIN